MFCSDYWLAPLTLNLLTTTIVAPPSNDRKWQMGFNSAFKGLVTLRFFTLCALVGIIKCLISLMHGCNCEDQFQEVSKTICFRNFLCVCIQ